MRRRRDQAREHFEEAVHVEVELLGDGRDVVLVEAAAVGRQLVGVHRLVELPEPVLLGRGPLKGSCGGNAALKTCPLCQPGDQP